MGSSYSNERYWVAQHEAAAKLEEVQGNARRMRLADKIVMAIVDRISTAIIRPGPKPEERECYVMAQELRNDAPRLRRLVTRILKIEETESQP